MEHQAAKGKISMGVERTAEPWMTFWLRTHEEHPAESGAGTLVRVTAAPSAKLADLFVVLASWGDVLHGAGHDDYELAYIDHELLPGPQRPIELRAIFQYNVLGKQLVAELGKDRVMSTPGVKIQELPNGGVFIDAGTSAAVHAQAFAHLCPGKPVPPRDIPARVKPAWDFEMAPVFATLVERTAMEERNELITRLNQLTPAPPELVTPPREANLGERAVAQYRSVADELVVLLHDKEPALAANAGPEVLPLIDIYFYEEDFPRTRGERTEHVLRPLGAWLGELLVRELDGHWVPRGKLDEIQVVVGDTAFLPLLRARRYLASRDAVLEYSLTKYFADAKRLVGRR